jgi:nitrite reductase/ring-hydroxylating ferredoxin subunit
MRVPTDDSLLVRWFPIAASADLPKRHVFHAELLGQELAVWRADDDFVNVWENRCLHRGVRLTIGHNLGDALKCQYHGWRYASRTAACTYVPAHPANAPATFVRNRTFDAVEQDGFVWTRLKTGDAAPPAFGDALTLRSIPVHAWAGRVTQALPGYRFAPNGRLNADLDGCKVTIEPMDAFITAGRSRHGHATTDIRLMVQPVRNDHAIIHGLVLGPVDEVATLAVLRHHNAALTRLRDAVEAGG